MKHGHNHKIHLRLNESPRYQEDDRQRLRYPAPSAAADFVCYGATSLLAKPKRQHRGGE